jgi:hypothetical protein
MDEGLNSWYEALRRGIQLSETTKCDTLEILQYSSLTKPQWSEGTVDDSTLPEWLNAVCLNCTECIKRSLISYFLQEPSMPYATTQTHEEPTAGLRLLYVPAIIERLFD